MKVHSVSRFYEGEDMTTKEVLDEINEIIDKHKGDEEELLEALIDEAECRMRSLVDLREGDDSDLDEDDEDNYDPIHGFLDDVDE